MFDVGFWELVLIAFVALTVFGPERLPKLIREVALWVRRFRAVAHSARQEIDRELNLYEIQEGFREKQRQFERETKHLEQKVTTDGISGTGLSLPEQRIDVKAHHE